jgi:hypothetical protein
MMNRARDFVEKNTQVVIQNGAATNNWYALQTTDTGWHHALGGYNAAATIDSVSVKDRTCYKMTLRFHVSDVYHFKVGTGKVGFLCSDEELALLHRRGKARSFDVRGVLEVRDSWGSGERR